MKPSKPDIESLFLEIQSEITSVNVDEEFRRGILKDMELAIESFEEKNILSVINCLGVIAGKLQTYVLCSYCRCSVVEKLLIGIHRLQQILIRLPVCVIGPAGATGATGPAGCDGNAGATGATGPAGPAGSMSIVTSTFPATCFPIPKKDRPKHRLFDDGSHIITCGNSCRK